MTNHHPIGRGSILIISRGMLILLSMVFTVGKEIPYYINLQMVLCVKGGPHGKTRVLPVISPNAE